MQILQTSKGWFANLMMEMDSIIKAVILHQSKGTPFSKLLPKGKSVIHKVCAVNEPAAVMLCCHGTAKLEPQIQGVIFNSFPLKTLFVVSMAKMMIVMRALCADSLPLKRGCFPLSCAVFSQTVKKSPCTTTWKVSTFPVWQSGLHLGLFWTKTVGVKPWWSEASILSFAPCLMFYPVCVEGLVLKCIISHYYQLTAGVFH